MDRLMHRGAAATAAARALGGGSILARAVPATEDTTGGAQDNPLSKHFST